jgi:hypothetical protein
MFSRGGTLFRQGAPASHQFCIRNWPQGQVERGKAAPDEFRAWCLHLTLSLISSPIGLLIDFFAVAHYARVSNGVRCEQSSTRVPANRTCGTGDNVLLLGPESEKIGDPKEDPGLFCRASPEPLDWPTEYEFTLFRYKDWTARPCYYPKKLRERVGSRPRIGVEFVDERGRLVQKKVERGADPAEAVAGSCKGSLRKLGFVTAGEYLEALRGR